VNHARRGIVVELLGAPGAGKSALAGALSALHGVTVVKDHQRGDLCALAWSATRSLPVVLAAPKDADRLRWAAWAGRLSAASAVARRRQADGSTMVVFDQGAAYTLMRMADARHHPWGNAWWCRRVAQTAGLLDLLVLVDADTDTLVSRIRGREKTHAALQLSDQQLRDYVQAERRSCHEIADALTREGADVLRVVTSEGSPEEQVDEILGALPRHLARPA
jgi:thymidylate kinase